MKRLGLQLFTFLMVLSMLSLSVAVADVNLPSWSSFPLLQNGDDEKAVRAVRVIAKYYNPSSIGVSTTFDTATENAVKKFQKNYGFSKNDQDGIVGPQTWNAMHSVLGQKTQITGGGTGNGTPSSSGGYWGYKVYQHSVGSYTSLFYFRTDANHPTWLDTYQAAPGSTPGTWLWVHPYSRQ